MVLLSSSNMTSNPTVVHGVLDCLLYRKEHGDNIERYHFVNALKYLNSLGGVMLLDTLSRAEIAELANKQLNKDFGVIVYNASPSGEIAEEHAGTNDKVTV